ncbi:MAG TPA: gliding motility-associated C-terminal domain-containing protein [Bacteroidia bacterium]|nr:gliding motility-associated C-terminal domain-containing protein [Bacteroidia bacterium]
MIPRLVVSTLLWLLSLIANGQDLFINTFNCNLYAVQTTTCTFTLIGNTGIFLTDIAVSPNGTLYGIDGTNLYTISTANAGLTPVTGVSPLTSFEVALVCDQNGDLYAAGYDLWKLNWTTGNWDLLGSLSPYSAGGDLTFYEGDMYLACTNQELVKIDMITMNLQNMGIMNSANGPILGIVTVETGSPNPCGSGSLENVMYACAGSELLWVDVDNAATTFSCGLPISSMISGAASPAESMIQYGSTDLYDLVAPNVFTPGDDHINDLFAIGIANRGCYVVNSLEVFDRWGRSVFSGIASDEWDGQAKDGNPCVTGTYYWLARIRRDGEEEQFRTGIVTLIR